MQIQTKRFFPLLFAREGEWVMKIETNVGLTDKIVRLALAVLLAGLNLFGQVSGLLGIVLWVFAAVLVLTSVVSFCPLYLPFKISTKGK